MADGEGEHLAEADARRPWTAVDDAHVVRLVGELGTRQWTRVAEELSQVAHRRTGKQCRERWHNHLDPDVNKRPWTDEEEALVFQLQKKIGNKWSEIAKHLPGRTDNNVKNRYYSTCRRRARLAEANGGNNGAPAAAASAPSPTPKPKPKPKPKPQQPARAPPAVAPPLSFSRSRKAPPPVLSVVPNVPALGPTELNSPPIDHVQALYASMGLPTAVPNDVFETPTGEGEPGDAHTTAPVPRQASDAAPALQCPSARYVPPPPHTKREPPPPQRKPVEVPSPKLDQLALLASSSSSVAAAPPSSSVAAPPSSSVAAAPPSVIAAAPSPDGPASEPAPAVDATKREREPEEGKEQGKEEKEKERPLPPQVKKLKRESADGGALSPLRQSQPDGDLDDSDINNIFAMLQQDAPAAGAEAPPPPPPVTVTPVTVPPVTVPPVTVPPVRGPHAGLAGLLQVRVEPPAQTALEVLTSSPSNQMRSPAADCAPLIKLQLMPAGGDPASGAPAAAPAGSRPGNSRSSGSRVTRGATNAAAGGGARDDPLSGIFLAFADPETGRLSWPGLLRLFAQHQVKEGKGAKPVDPADGRVPLAAFGPANDQTMDLAEFLTHFQICKRCTDIKKRNQGGTVDVAPVVVRHMPTAFELPRIKACEHFSWTYCQGYEVTGNPKCQGSNRHNACPKYLANCTLWKHRLPPKDKDGVPVVGATGGEFVAVLPAPAAVTGGRRKAGGGAGGRAKRVRPS